MLSSTCWLAIFCWFVGYNAIEAFFTLYAVNQLGLDASDGAGLLGHLSLFFVLFALVSGFIGGKAGRRVTISAGIILLAVLIGIMFVLPPDVLAAPLAKLPVLGTVRSRQPVPDGGGDRLGVDQYQFLAHGGGYGGRCAHRDVYRAVLPVFHTGGDCRAERQWLGDPTYPETITTRSCWSLRFLWSWLCCSCSALSAARPRHRIGQL